MESFGVHERVVHAVRAHDVAALATALRTVDATDVALCDVVQQFRDAQRRSLAHIAIVEDSNETLAFALDNGLDVDDPSCVDSDNQSPVTCAMLQQRLSALRVLLAYGASAGVIDIDNRSLLHLLAMHSNECDLDASSSSYIVDVLLRNGDVDIDARDQSGNTALHLAAVYGSPSVAAALLHHGADANAVNESGSSPLHFAAAAGDIAIVQLLLAAGAYVDATDAVGNTALIDAAFVTQRIPTTHFAFGDHASQSRVVALLLAHGADASAVNCDGNSALFGAVRNGFEDVVAQLCVATTTSFQQRNSECETLLHVAARAQVTNVSIWKTLLACCGLDGVRARDRFERTCVHIWMAWPQSFAAADTNDNGDVSSSIRAVSKLLLAAT